jgi:glycosyltransferase involved in cell wall biosynthesis
LSASRLNILHISATDNVGGSGRSAYRIHRALKQHGHESRMLVSYRTMPDPDVGMIWRTQPYRLADYACSVLTDALSLQYLYFPSSFRLRRDPWFHQCDVLQLYNIHGKYFSHSALPLLSHDRPVVWRLSDMWPMTGHCAYSYDCKRWLTGCGECPIVHDEPRLRTDRTAFLWRTKKNIYDRSRIHIVAPSRWIADLAKRSPLLERFPIHWIPNGLDTHIFRPIDKRVARELLNLSLDERVVLFSAVETTAERKGGHILTELFSKLAHQATGATRVLIVGNGAEQWKNALALPVTTRDLVRDDTLLAAIYSAADVFAYPTLAENLPNGILESMSCGTPVVAFDVGGVADAVRPGQTGFLTPPKNLDDFVAKIVTVLSNDRLRSEMSARCREIAAAEYDAELQCSRFEDLYESIRYKA